MKENKSSVVRTVIGVVGVIIVLVAGVLIGQATKQPKEEKLAELPKPEISEGMRGELGIDKNINESTIDNYLNRSDSVYRDVRLFDDPGNYAAIGGDSYMSGIIEGFEVVPYPYLAPLAGLPEAVGKGYTGKTLFSTDKNGNYVANYVESKQILEDLFPKDKVIFIMCGGGGYAGMTKALLVSQGWDADKIYDIGGYWYYEGDHKVQIKTTIDGVDTYAFWKVNYHSIDFNTLHKKA
ncbi:MAG: hypothetical protein Q4E47_02360 [Candidatus Saccharibacteria bacterium]|nr:hypothetical protein [Candidatus Saccharibacteria bacterium]